MSQGYATILERAEHNWAAYVPDLPGCITTVETLEETERNIKEAVWEFSMHYGGSVSRSLSRTSRARRLRFHNALYGR